VAQTYRDFGRPAEAIAAYEEVLRHDPQDALAYYSRSIAYAYLWGVKDKDPANVDVALGYLDRSLAVERNMSYALVQKAALVAAWKGDLPAANATLDRLGGLPHQEVAEDRAVFMRMWVALLDRQPAKALAAASLTTATYFSDNVVPGPVAWMKALAHRQAGRANAAAEEWRAAEAVLRARLAATPDSLPTQAELAVTLAMLGRKDEAVKQFARFDASRRDQGLDATMHHVRFHTAMGDAKRAAAAISDRRLNRLDIWTTDAVLARDPWYDGIRDRPEFKALAATKPGVPNRP
jgi:tetratricopeptide (TPR) repeat protein